jgi:hypothetical protein
MKNNTYILCLIIAFLGVYTEGSFAQVAVNTDGSAADTKAMLDVKSTDKGLLIPRMTSAQRIGITGLSASQKGLLVYDTDSSSVYHWKGTAWEQISGSGSTIWKVKNDSTIYTTNKQVGINTNDPQAALDISGGGFIVQNKRKTPFNTAVNIYEVPTSGTITVDDFPATRDSMGIIKSHSGAGSTNYSANIMGVLSVFPKSAAFLDPKPIGVRLTFTHFNTEATNDIVTIQDITDDFINNVSFSGSTLPAVFNYSSANIGNGFRVKFQTNAAIHGTGFILKYEFIFAESINTVIGKSLGTGLMYDLSKNAVIMGNLSKTNAQIGVGSTALGGYTSGYPIASGTSSTALGSSAASGFASMASGNSEAQGAYSTASGTSLASGNYSTALGSFSVANGTASTATGYAFSNGDYSTASGFSSMAVGYASTAFGFNATASGYAATALGNNAKAVGDNTLSNGYFTYAKSYASIAIGRYNDSIASSSNTTWVATDPLFIAGNGTSNAARSNALVLYKNGNLIISGNLASGNSTASGQYSAAMGQSTASAQFSIAVGQSTASGGNSTALGQSTASGSNSTALGQSSALGSHSIASGYFTTASGNNSTAFGLYSQATGNGSTALGQAYAWGYYASALGGGVASGDYSTAMNVAYAKAYACTAIGFFNDSINSSSKTTWVATDPLFIAGNGTSHTARANALTLLKNGNMGFGSIIAPTYRIEIPNSFYTDGQGKAGAWVTYSDNRVKFNQKPLQYGLSHIMQMKVKSYDHYSSEFKNGALVLGKSKPTFGLIAQELYKIIPEMVNKPTDESKDLWSVDYDKFGPLLVKTVQEQQAQIEDLKQQIATLQLQEKRITDLEKQAADFNALKADMATLKAALQTAVGQKGDPSVKTASTERK